MAQKCDTCPNWAYPCFYNQRPAWLACNHIFCYACAPVVAAGCDIICPMCSVSSESKILRGNNIFIKVPNGPTATLFFEACDDVRVYKELYVARFGGDANHLRFIHAGRQMEDGNRLSDYNIHKDATIHAVWRACGD